MTITRVECTEWAEAVSGLKQDGYRFLDYLTAVDRIDQVEVVAHLVDPDSGRASPRQHRGCGPGRHVGTLTTCSPARTGTSGRPRRCSGSTSSAIRIRPRCCFARGRRRRPDAQVDRPLGAPGYAWPGDH